MAGRLDESRAFVSRFGAGRLSPAQFLAEGVCARQARRDRIKLPNHFWASSKRWADEFLRQTVHATRLLTEFSAEAIVGALRTRRGRQIYSLGRRAALVPLVRIEQERLHRPKAVEKAHAESRPRPAGAERPRPLFITQKSTLEKLRELD
jgi:hypothetical protein